MLGLATIAVLPLVAGDFRFERLAESPPGEISEPLRAALAGEGIRLVDASGEPFFDLWLRKEIPRRKPDGDTPTGVKFGEIEEGSFLGVVRVPKKRPDFRDFSIPKGIYTLRYGIQPVDGNHVGVSETRDFALLCPTKEDSKLEPMPTKAIEKLSVKVSGTKHPSLLYFRPARETRVSYPFLVSDEEKEWKILEASIPFAGEKEAFLRFGLVVSGKAEEP